MLGGMISTHRGILFFCDHAPFRAPLHAFVDGPLISNPSSQDNVQLVPKDDF